MQKLVTRTTGLFLRYLRHGRSVGEMQTASFDLRRDLEFLKINWSISSDVVELINFLNDQQFAIKGVSEYYSEQSDVLVRGQLEVSKTVMQRQMTGNPNLVSYRSASKVFDTGKNAVLLWTLLAAEKYCRQMVAMFPASAAESNSEGTLARAHAQLFAINRAKRNPFIRQAAESYRLAQRPNHQSYLQAKKDRNKLYRLSAKALKTFQQLEYGDEEEVCRLLQETLVLPKEDYQILELALAFSMGEALANETGHELVLKQISLTGNSMVLSVGDVVIDWQSRTDSYQPPVLEPSEQKLADLLPFYGLRASHDRPDLIVRNLRTDTVLAIGEAKSFKDATGWRDPMRDALYQIIRYSRGYALGAQQDNLIGRSCIGLMYYPQTDRPAIIPATAPIIVDASDIESTLMAPWLDRVRPLL